MGQVDELKAAAAHARGLLAKWKQMESAAEAARKHKYEAAKKYQEAFEVVRRIEQRIRTDSGADLPYLSKQGVLDE